MNPSIFQDEQQANAHIAMLLCCRLSTAPNIEPLSPAEYHSVVAALDSHALPAVAVQHIGHDGTTALQQAGFNDQQINRIAALSSRETALRLRATEWAIRGITSIACCQDQYPSQLRKFEDEAPPVIHLTSNQALLNVDHRTVRPVITEWAMSPRAESIIAHVAAEIVDLDLTLAVSTAHQAGRQLLAETIDLGGRAIAVVDGTPLQEMIQPPETRQRLEGGRLLLLSTHDPDVRMRSTQHHSQRLVLALGGDHVDLRTGRRPRATIQHTDQAAA